MLGYFIHELMVKWWPLLLAIGYTLLMKSQNWRCSFEVVEVIFGLLLWWTL